MLSAAFTLSPISAQICSKQAFTLGSALMVIGTDVVILISPCAILDV
jgi:hypothetical protein